jgi:hypothetical protein
MVQKNQVINGVMAFMDNNMIPNAKDNYKIILRTIRSGMANAPEKVWDLIKDNAIIAMTGAVQGEHVDVDLLARILTEGFGGDEFSLGFKLLGSEYKIYLSGEDIRMLKGYIERA